MSLRIFSDIKLPVGSSENELYKLVRKKLGGEPRHFVIRKKSLDARDKNDLRYVYTVECARTPQTKRERHVEQLAQNKRPENPVLIVGSGPAGLFCALRLLEHGVTPVVIERGAPVEEREKIVNAFFEKKFLDTQTNIQFGEGGAGTFSDGKLNTQTHSELNREVLETFVRFGAPQEILYLSKPHVGSDNLKKVVKNMREHIVKQGGQVLFHTQLTDIEIADGRVKTVTWKRLDKKKSDGDSMCEKLPVSALILAVGHSARDTFEMLLKRGVPMRQKDFAIGVRIEHLQSKIGLAQYGKNYTMLPAADYKLVSHASERAAFTFCMCPGGYVMPATSEDGGVVTNGMSNYARDGENANSALIAQVGAADFKSDAPLAGVEFQRQLERAAYLAGGSGYAAPLQRLEDFLADRPTTRFGEVRPTYAAGTKFAELREILPLPVVETLKNAVLDMNKRLRGFADPDALLTAVESRTSSPVRIERNGELQSVGVTDLYPCGEGAGYAGGITSSAADGLRVAEAVFNRFSNR